MFVWQRPLKQLLDSQGFVSNGPRRAGPGALASNEHSLVRSAQTGADPHQSTLEDQCGVPNLAATLDTPRSAWIQLDL